MAKSKLNHKEKQKEFVSYMKRVRIGWLAISIGWSNELIGLPACSLANYTRASFSIDNSKLIIVATSLRVQVKIYVLEN